jgi:lipooligosaccharide transport system permease protein
VVSDQGCKITRHDQTYHGQTGGFNGFPTAFFPVDQLPGWMQPIAWATPLWHGVEACRDVATGTVSAGPLAGHLLVLAGYVAVGGWLAERSFARRLVP